MRCLFEWIVAVLFDLLKLRVPEEITLEVVSRTSKQKS